MATLVFEGAGWAGADSSKATNVGNCRIRTAFTNNEGKQIYLEMNSVRIYKGKSKEVIGYYPFIDFCFYITGDKQNCNNNRLTYDKTTLKNIEYTKEDITAWVNDNLNCSFDTMEVLENGYRVHADNKGYNLIENIF